MAQYLLKQFIADGDPRVEHDFNLTVINHELALKLHGTRNLSARRLIGCRSRRPVIIQAGDGRTPIIDQEGPVILHQRTDAQIDGVSRSIPRLREINPAKIGRYHQLFIFFERLAGLQMMAFAFVQNLCLLPQTG